MKAQAQFLFPIEIDYDPQKVGQIKIVSIKLVAIRKDTGT